MYVAKKANGKCWRCSGMFVKSKECELHFNGEFDWKEIYTMNVSLNH